MKRMILLLLFLIGCDYKENILSLNKSIELPDIVYFQSINPSNDSNPIDSVGFYHNYMLDYHITNTSSSEYDSTLIRQEIYYNMGILGDIGTFNTNRELNENRVNFYYSDVYGRTIPQLISEFAINQYVITKITDLNQTVNNYEDSVLTNIYTLNGLLNEIMEWEDEVMDSLNYYTYDSTNMAANQLLGCSSIYRYSICYWLSVSEDSTNSWNKYLIEPPVVNIKKVEKYNKVKVQQTEKKLTVWDVLEIAGIDVIGYFAGAEMTDNQGQKVKIGAGVLASVTASAAYTIMLLDQKKKE